MYEKWIQRISLLLTLVLACISCIGCADDDDFYTLDNPEFTFHGKLFDQDDVPIRDCPVNYSIDVVKMLNMSFYIEDVKSSVKTDSQGSFVIHNHGNKLYINPIKFPGCEFSFSTNPKTSFGYAPPSTFGDFVANQADPFTFILRKKNKPAFLMGNGPQNNSARIFKKDVPQEVDISRYLIETWTDNNGLPGNLPSAAEVSVHGRREVEKDLRIQGEMSEDHTEFNLLFSVLPEDSGLIISEDLLYEAPVDGYQASVQITVSKGQVWEKYIYFKINDGSFYGRMLCGIRYNQYGALPPTLTISYESWINPEGSRNLEYDEEYQSEEEQWRYLLKKLRYIKKSGGIKSLEPRKLAEEYGLAYLPEWKTEEQFFDELRQLRAQKDAQNPKWWHKFDKK